MNREGYDFVVFENSLNDHFLELAFVEVSSDGIHYVRFPATSNTPTDKQVGGFGSLDPTKINNLAGKYRIGWGTPFDLSEVEGDDKVDVNAIRYVKIIDVVGSIDTLYAIMMHRSNYQRPLSHRFCFGRFRFGRGRGY